MVAVFGKKMKTRPVKGGDVQKRKCPECGETAMFRESTVEKKYTAYVVFKLWETESTAYVCDACDAAMDLEDTEDPALSAREQKKLDKARAEADATAKADAKRRKAEAQAKAERDKAAQEEAIDDEIAQMKKKLGIE